MSVINDALTKSRTLLWCVPRSVSTSLTICLSEIDDLQVGWEPFHFCRLAKIDARLHFGESLPNEYVGNEEIYQKTGEILNELRGGDFDPELLSYSATQRMLEDSCSRYVFVKDIARGVPDVIRHMPRGYKHTFLIRHPFRTINSYRNAIFRFHRQGSRADDDDFELETFDLEKDNPYCPDGCFVKDLYDIWKFVRENIDKNPIVIDGDDLLAQPAKIISNYCSAVGLPYEDKFLKWGDLFRKANRWTLSSARHPQSIFVYRGQSSFFETTLSCTEFQSPKPLPRRDQLSPDVIRVADQVMGYYNEMYESRIKL